MRSSCFGTFLLCCSLTSTVSGQAGREPIRPFHNELEAIFNRHEYAAKTVKFAWQKDGAIYTILEPSPNGKGTDIIAYDSGSGKRSVLITAAQLTPAGEAGKSAGPLAVDEYAWSPDQKKL